MCSYRVGTVPEAGQLVSHLKVCLYYLAEVWQAYVHPRPQAGAQVGGTCEDVAQMLVPHELPASLLDQMLHLYGM